MPVFYGFLFFLQCRLQLPMRASRKKNRKKRKEKKRKEKKRKKRKEKKRKEKKRKEKKRKEEKKEEKGRRKKKNGPSWFWAELVQNVGRVGFGPSWYWADLVLGRVDQRPARSKAPQTPSNFALTCHQRGIYLALTWNWSAPRYKSRKISSPKN